MVTWVTFTKAIDSGRLHSFDTQLVYFYKTMNFKVFHIHDSTNSHSSVKKWIFCLCFVVLHFSSHPVFGQHSNELIHESSPYLLQHAHNPVNWYPWGEVALNKAKSEDKMLLISIGYAACHWCHVMEKESFEDTAVARVMNENFVCIKVDREERPDVDQVYMTAAQMTSGNGGWPLNAFAMPDGSPFYGATYFERDQWLRLLNYFIDLYKTEPGKLIEQAAKVSQGIASMNEIKLGEKGAEFTLDGLGKAVEHSFEKLDPLYGGMNGEPKFPMPAIWEFLLHYGALNQDQKSEDAVYLTLDKLACGGIYDHVGGGFARYSTDGIWKVPHFEKMLYDNAQLVSVYAHAWQQTKNPLYKEVVYGTLEFIAREMTSDEGGFYSSLDADSEGEEGRYYVWTSEELSTALGDNAALFADYYNCSPKFAWEESKYILHRAQSDAEVAKKFGISEAELRARLAHCRNILLQLRSKRVPPALDNKQLTAWNALMLQAYVDAYRAFGDEQFLNAALKNAAFLEKNALHGDQGMTRTYIKGKSSISAFLDDYAFVISAWIELYQATFDERWLMKARQLTEVARTQFFDASSGMFFYTSSKEVTIVARSAEVNDNVIPSSNSEMALNLFKLGHYFYDTSYMALAERMLINVSERMHENIFYYANWARLECFFANAPFEVAIVGSDANKLRAELDTHFIANVFLYGAEKTSSLELLEGKLIPDQTTIFVCRNRACKMPVTKVEEALKLMEE